MARRDDEVWTVKRTLDWTRGYLASKGDEHPRLSAEWLLSAATGLSRVALYAYYDRPLSMDERDVLRAAVRRRAVGEPLQYVTGEVAFRHIVVKVEPGVLIPRPETEMLVEAGFPAVDAAIGERGEARVLDLCTGSGNIALSIAQERLDASVIATDISPVAVKVATRNADALGLGERVRVVECDLAEGLDDAESAFDLVISNPPYIPSAELSELPEEVIGFEPALALDGGADGLDVFRRILAEAQTLLRPGGMLACELHEDTLATAAALCADGYHEVTVLSDLAGRDRIVTAIRD